MSRQARHAEARRIITEFQGVDAPLEDETLSDAEYYKKYRSGLKRWLCGAEYVPSPLSSAPPRIADVVARMAATERDPDEEARQAQAARDALAPIQDGTRHLNVAAIGRVTSALLRVMELEDSPVRYPEALQEAVDDFGAAVAADQANPWKDTRRE